jgi:hypothetical protein
LERAPGLKKGEVSSMVWWGGLGSVELSGQIESLNTLN